MFRRITLANSHKILPENFAIVDNRACFCSKKSQLPDENEVQVPKPEHPFNRTVRVLKNDMITLKNNVVSFVSRVRKTHEVAQRDIKTIRASRGTYHYEIFPEHCDIAIIGGGVMGSSIAYWLKQKVPHAITVTVVEKDPSVNQNSLLMGQYAGSSTALSVGGIRQQFSLEENIQMSLFGADFLRNIKKHLTVEGHDPPDICFSPYGYLFLATEKGAAQLEENSTLQNKLGARNELLSPNKLKQKFPWLNTDNIALGCHGLENEGWFDPWCLLSALKKKAISLGVEYVSGEVVGFDFKEQPDLIMEGVEFGSYESVDKIVVRKNNGEVRTIKFGIVIIAAGASSRKVAEMARIGTRKGLLSFPLPVEPRKRYVYCFNCKNGPGLNTPLVVDPSGVYFRREGFAGNYICGRSPSYEDEPSIDNLDVDYNYFDTHLWPELAARVPAFESLKVNNAWAGFYEYNTFDENGIIGPHPYYHNLYIAAGFSGHGIQQAPAVGRSMMEMILEGGFRTIDLRRMSFDRLLSDKPIFEQNIV